ncbi:glutathione S-transferase family protein [Rhodovibrio salinarum]|uniref:Glutathione S-transferase n=1 Tax=Rhodovibrio salinarum TaxID=1087 RepID=A0A934UZV7_9PROT|nr:glutathione S-transferase family protein [Rhodovibrio salinarum]MBK1696926.1 glutathione S-transferase [Rhodovibrio salinarum]
MELLLNATSPYARVCRICAIERGLAGRLRLRWVDPWADDSALLAVNPAGRVPALITDDGQGLAEALLIALHFNAHGTGPDLFPADDGSALARAGIGIGLMDAAFATVIARKHQGSESDRGLLGARRHRAIRRCLERLAVDTGEAGDKIDIGTLTVAVALDYLAFRLPEYPLADLQPNLGRWRARIAERPSFQETAFS